MVEDNHIDNLFRSALEPFEASPSEKVWSSLDAALSKRQSAIANGEAAGEKKKKKRRFLFLLLALVVGSFGGYEYFSRNGSTTKNQVVSTEVDATNKKQETRNIQPQTNPAKEQ